MYHPTTDAWIASSAYFSTEIFPYSSENESEKFIMSNATSKFHLAKLYSQNWWNVFDEKYLNHSLESIIAITIILLCILVIGIIGNFSVILILLGYPHMRSVTNMFIMNLAVADLLVILFYVPFKLLQNIFRPWILGSFTCKCVSYIQMVSICASAYSLVAISLVRCRAVYQSFGQIRLSKSQTMKIIILIWITAALLLSPLLVVFRVVSSETDGLPYCIETWENQHYGRLYYIITNLIICYCIPLAIISSSSGIICLRVTYRAVPEETASKQTIKQMHKKARNHIRRMLGMVTLAFLVSWLPKYVIFTRMKLACEISEYENNLYEILVPFAEMLGSANSCVNPVLNAFLNKEFRESMHSLLPSPLRPNTRRESLASMCMVSYGVTASNIIRPNTLRYQIDSRLLQGCAKRYSEAYLKPCHYQYQRHRHSYPNYPVNLLEPGNFNTSRSRTPSPSRSPNREFSLYVKPLPKNVAASTVDIAKTGLDFINEL